jgi:hypothetical protein
VGDEAACHHEERGTSDAVLPEDALEHVDASSIGSAVAMRMIATIEAMGAGRGAGAAASA